jgi:hypothetical protein
MLVNLLTYEDFQQLKAELISDLKAFLKKESTVTKKWLKSEEVKKILKVSAGTLQTLRVNGTLPYTKIGGILYYDYEYIEKVMEENLRSRR